MKKILLAIVLLFFAGCASTQSAIKNNASFAKYKKIYLLSFEEDPRHVLPKVKEQLTKLGFEVVVTENDEPLGGNQGTGFIISPDGYILTSAHILGKKKEATVWMEGKRYEAEVVYIEKDPALDEDTGKDKQKNKTIKEAMDASLNSKDNRSIEEQLKEKDMALLKIKSPDQTFPAASFAIDPQYQMGQDVYTIGFPLSNILGDKPRLNKGLISSTVGIKDNPNFVQMSVEIQPGNSGGPLLNEKGQVVGMVQMTLNPMSVLSQTGEALPQNVNFAVKGNSIAEFLKNAKEKAQLSLREGQSAPFEEVQKSIVQIRSGIIPEGYKEESKLACSVSYQYIWDMWYRFQVLDVVFYDVDTQEVLLRAGQYGDNPFSSEGKTLNQVFKEIRTKMAR